MQVVKYYERKPSKGTITPFIGSYLMTGEYLRFLLRDGFITITAV